MIAPPGGRLTVPEMDPVFCVEASCSGGSVSWVAFQRQQVVSTRYVDHEQAGPSQRTFADARTAREALRAAIHLQVHHFSMHIGYSVELADQGTDWWLGGGVDQDFAQSWEQAARAPFLPGPLAVPLAVHGAGATPSTTRPPARPMAAGERMVARGTDGDGPGDGPVGGLVLFSGLGSSADSDRTARSYRSGALACGAVASTRDDLLLAWVPRPELLWSPWDVCRTEAFDFPPDRPLGRPRIQDPAWHLSLGPLGAFRRRAALELALGLLSGRNRDDLRRGHAVEIVHAAARLARRHGDWQAAST